MDITHAINNLFSIILVFVVPLSIILAILKAPIVKGVFGELQVNIFAKLFLNDSEYQLLRNVIIPIEEGTTQIDHVIVSKFGIFVVETKNMKGWIFGNAHQKQWTQKIYKHTNTFQNPLHQNYKHLKALAKLLDIEESSIFSVVVFIGDIKFKTPMPENVTYAGGYIKYIKSKTRELIPEYKVLSIVKQIQSSRYKPSLKTTLQHIGNVQTIHIEKEDVKICSRCGKRMIRRTAKKGPNEGTEFWGCSGFPRCRNTESIN